VFNDAEIQTIAKNHTETFRKLDHIRTYLEGQFEGMEDAVLALILSVASGEPLLLIGPPGTGKSLLIRSFSKIIGDPKYFEYLLTPFTEPGELWGFYDIQKLAKHEGLERMNKEEMMQSAVVVFLDEVFKGSSAILNSLLPFMNERVFYDRGKRTEVALQCLFAATNELPEAEELRAALDRFVLRCRVENIRDTRELGRLLGKSWPLTYGPSERAPQYPNLLGDLKAMRATIQSRAARMFQPSDEVLGRLAQRVVEARRYGLSAMSNRRLTKFLFIMLIHRLYTSVSGRVGRERYPWQAELDLLFRFFLDRDDEEIVSRLTESPIAGAQTA
jgi:MoxR-like ATPase